MTTAAYALLIYVIGWWLAAIAVKGCFKTNTFYNFFHNPWSGKPDEYSIWIAIFFWPVLLLFLLLIPFMLLLGWVLDKVTVFITK